MAKAKILGKLRGIIASAKESSRNNRRYSEGFWDAKFNSDLFKEGLDNKMFFGELYHPDDSEEYEQIHCDDRSAIVLTDVKKNGLDYIGTFEIIPTKAGQCLRNLLDIGCHFGISSRGIADHDAEVFDESMASNYELITWDIVAFPGLKCCRLEEIGAVAESLKVKNKAKVQESLNNLAKSDSEISEYIKYALKAKEDFDTQLQVEDIFSDSEDLPSDLLDYVDLIEIKNNKATFDDGIHGKAKVKGIKETQTGYYIADKIVWDNENKNYVVFGPITFVRGSNDE